MSSGIRIATQVVRGIPPDGIGPGGKVRLAHQVPHAAAIGGLDHQRYVAGRVEREANGDRGM